MSTTFCTWSVVLVETNFNPACLEEEIDLMEMDGIKFNLSWQEIEVDNLMGLDEIKSNPAWQEVEVDKSDESG